MTIDECEFQIKLIQAEYEATKTWLEEAEMKVQIYKHALRLREKELKELEAKLTRLKN